jgi:hypothetical protein
MNRETEDRLRAALAARADQVTPDSLRREDLPAPSKGRRAGSDGTGRRPVWVWGGVAAGVAAAVAAIVVGVTVGTDDGSVEPAGPSPSTPTSPRATTVTGSDCAGEADLVSVAFGQPGAVSADVDGDGADDAVIATVDDQASPACRAFVGVRTATGSTYSTALDPRTTTPRGAEAVVVGVPDLGADGDAEIVVDTAFAGDGLSAQLFSLTDGGLVWVPTGAFEDGSFYVEGGGVTFPRGAGCTPQGELVLSMASLVERAETYEVTRQFYPATGDPIELGSPRVETDRVPAETLPERFPEFGTDHWGACS